MKILHSHPLYTFHLIEDPRPILKFEWSEDLSQLNYRDFQAFCHNFAGFAWQHQVKHLLVDTTNFSFILPEEFQEWREKELNPRYQALGVTKFAYMIMPEYFHMMNDIPAKLGSFETRHFIEERQSIIWLNE